MAYRILIVDDEELLTELLSAHLRACGYEACTAKDSREALERLNPCPDLILLDIQLPGTSGLELCRLIREHVSCPILFLTARVTEQDKVNGLTAGGDDYITKPFSLRELTARVEAHLRREGRRRAVRPLNVSQGLLVDIPGRTVRWEGTDVVLSRREFDILAFLVQNPNQVFDREKIYEAVWGHEAEGDSLVIKEHVRKIRGKLQAVAGAGFIETVWGIGYLWNA